MLNIDYSTLHYSSQVSLEIDNIFEWDVKGPPSLIENFFSAAFGGGTDTDYQEAFKRLKEATKGGNKNR